MTLAWFSLLPAFASTERAVVLIFAEIGVGLTALGIFLLIIGVIFLFDRGLLAMGNVSLCVGGV